MLTNPRVWGWCRSPIKQRSGTELLETQTQSRAGGAKAEGCFCSCDSWDVLEGTWCSVHPPGVSHGLSSAGCCSSSCLWYLL